MSTNYELLVYMYYTHSGYRTSIFGKKRAYYIEIFTVMFQVRSEHSKNNWTCRVSQRQVHSLL